MTVSKKLFIFLIIGICMFSLNINVVSAGDQICLKLTVGETTSILQLGPMNYGYNHVSLSGKMLGYDFGGSLYDVGLVHGNAEIVNGNVEVSLTQTIMSGDGQTASFMFIHLRLDIKTLNGSYIFIYPGGISLSPGTAIVVSCSGLP